MPPFGRHPTLFESVVVVHRKTYSVTATVPLVADSVVRQVPPELTPSRWSVAAFARVELQAQTALGRAADC